MNQYKMNFVPPAYDAYSEANSLIKHGLFNKVKLPLFSYIIENVEDKYAQFKSLFVVPNSMIFGKQTKVQLIQDTR